MDELAPIIDEPADPSPTPSADALAALNSRQRAFVLAYIAGHSAVRASEIAGYRQGQAHASRILSHPAVRKAIGSIADQAAMGAAEVTLRLSEIASFDASAIGDKVYRKDESGRKCVDWDAVERLGVGRFIHSVGLHGKSGIEQVKWYSRFDALSLLAKIHGLTSDQTNVQINLATASVEELRAIVNS